MAEIPIPNHSILPASSADLPTLAKFVHSSKLALTINRLLFQDWPNEAAQKPLYANAVESAFKDPSVESLKVVEDNSGEVVGYVALSRKRPANHERLMDDVNGNGRQNVPEGVNPDVYAAVIKAVNEVAEGRERIDYFELTYIYIKPSSRKHGVGSQLLQVCFDKAKAEGVPLILSSEPAAHEFFAKRGFRDTRHVDIDLSKWAPAFSGFGLFRLSGMIWCQ